MRVSRVVRHLIAPGLLLSGCAKPEIRQVEPAPAEPPPERPEPAAPASVPDASSPAPEQRVSERQAMVQETIAERGVRDPRVLEALRTVPRHLFVPEGRRGEAYADRPLPIVGGQTISQPYVVAFMTEAAKPAEGSRCLEIGTGSGYQAAVLAELCAETYSIEYLPEVAEFGAGNLAAAGYGPEKVRLRVGDGYTGWPEVAPFDVILVTAAPERVPEPLLEQLAVGGRLIVPVGSRDDTQRLERWTRRREGDEPEAFERQTLLGVRFVPFLREAQESEQAASAE